MKNTKKELPPGIIEHLNPVTLQSGPLSYNSNQMQIPASVKKVPEFIDELLTETEQAMCDAATD